MKEIIPVLQDQSIEFSLNRLKIKDERKNNDFKIYADGGLDILDSRANCVSLECRLEISNRLGKSLGLIADEFYVTDYINYSLCMTDKFNGNDLCALFDNFLIVYNLMPLVVSGVIKFREATDPVCKSCLNIFEKKVDEITNDVYLSFRKDFTLEPMGDRKFAIHTKNIFDPPVVLWVEKKHKKWRKKIDWEDQYYYIIRSAIRQSLWTGGVAARGGGSVFTNSNAGVSAVMCQEGRFSNDRVQNIFDQKRELVILWVNDLDISQIIELREEAGRAFPLFREKISSHLSGGGDNGNPVEIIKELKYESRQVVNELDLILKKSVSFWKKPFSIMSLGVAAVSIAVDQPLGAAAGLLPLLQLLGDHRLGRHAEEQSVKSKPGYVLVKAEEILRHSH